MIDELQRQRAKLCISDLTEQAVKHDLQRDDRSGTRINNRSGTGMKHWKIGVGTGK